MRIVVGLVGIVLGLTAGNDVEYVSAVHFKPTKGGKGKKIAQRKETPEEKEIREAEEIAQWIEEAGNMILKGAKFTLKKWFLNKLSGLSLEWKQGTFPGYSRFDSIVDASLNAAIHDAQSRMTVVSTYLFWCLIFKS